MLTSLKITNYVFTVRNAFCPYKDYNNFLDGMLKVFKFSMLPLN
jgi:hypothetical protein